MNARLAAHRRRILINPHTHGPDVLTQFAFRVSSSENLLCRFTRQHPESNIVITPMISAPGVVPTEALYTILAPRGLARTLVDNHFEKEYGSFEIVAEHDEDRKSTRLNSSHIQKSRMPSSA